MSETKGFNKALDMNRRRFLALAGMSTSIVPLAGCIELGVEGASQRSPDTETPTPTPGDKHREVQISSVDDVPADAPLEPSVEVIQSSVTAEQTARIRVTVTNTADHPVWNTSVRIPAFSNFITQEGPKGQKLLLLKPDEQYDTATECWRAELNEPQLNNAYTDVVIDRRYSAGESKATTFDIYGHPENADPCLMPGEYPIENRYTITNDADSDEAKWEYKWGFSITVAES
jgi:hypothetical protein